MPASEPLRPDYHGRGIVNLMSSLLAACGGDPQYPPLSEVAEAELRGHSTVALMVIDGLGYEFLSRRTDSFLHQHLRARLTSVFPTTTASAITTYTSALAPQQHGLTGWFTYLRELGSVAAILPFRPRHGGPAYSTMGVDPALIYDFIPMADRLGHEPHVVSARPIADSDYSRISAGRARRHVYRRLAEYFDTVAALAQGSDGQRYVYAYWPELDSLSHQHGVASDAVEQHFRELDTGVEALARRLAGSGALLVICADHGLVDTGTARTVRLIDHPALAATLTLPLCGEPRVAYCYVHPSRRHQFRDYVHGELAECCDLVPAEQLLDEGYYGTGPAHPRLADRIGDYALVARGAWIIKDRILGEKPFDQVGVHGGLSAEELYVPLILVAT
jgi:hypothetical protein